MTRYQLSLHVEKLPKSFFGGRPDTYATIRVTGGPHEGKTLGQTETVYNCSHPDFTKVVFLDTDESINMPLTIQVHNARNQNVMGECTVEASEVARAPGHMVSIKNQGIVYVKASVWR